MAPRVERRLAAILAADVVGYSRLMEADEAGTHARLKALRQELIEPRIADHAGRIVKLTGDGVLVEFPSVVEAVLAAADIQRAVTEHQATVPEVERITFRIGINLGDVIFDEADIYGDGVNVAARLEALAEPGGICVSRTVHNHVRNKLDLAFEPAGAHQVKNIAEPVEVYRVRWDGQKAGTTKLPAKAWRRWAWPTAAAAVVMLILAGGAASWFWTGVPAKPTIASAGAAGAQAKPALPLPDQPSIAVLPFENLSGDPKQERLAGGLTEDVITDLSRFRELFVIARNSTEVYKGKAVDIREVGRELGVQYVLEGSLQIDGDRVRITAQLIDATTGNHVWAERYDRPLDDIFAVQDDVTQQIVGALGGWWGRLAQAGRENAHRKPPKSLDAYDLYLLGIELKHRHTREDNQKAQEVLKRAIALDPEFAGPYAVLAFSYLNDAAMGFGDDPAGSLRNMRAAAEKAVALDDADAMAHLALAIGDFYAHQTEAGAPEFERALTLGQSNADLLAIVAFSRPSKLPTGKEDVENVKRAMRLNPHHPEWYPVALGYAAYFGGLYDDAIAALRQVASHTMLEPPLYLALSYAELGREDEAAAAAKELLQIEPDFSAERQIDGDVFRGEAIVSHFIGSVRKAGLPVCMTEGQLAKYPGMTPLPLCEQQRAKS